MGGKTPLKMAELKISLTNNGLQNVATYIQSGNLLITSDRDKKTIKNIIFNALKNDFGYELPMVIISIQKLINIKNNNPILNLNTEELNKQFVVFATNKIHQDLLPENYFDKFEDTIAVKEDYIYLYCPKGAGKSKFNTKLLGLIDKI